MQCQLNKLVQQHIDSTMKEILKQLNDKLDGYKHNLNNKYVEKELELILLGSRSLSRQSQSCPRQSYGRLLHMHSPIHDTTKTHSIHG
jgi:hypothetical protein